MEKWHLYAREVKTQIEFAMRSWDAFIAAEKQEELIEIFLHLHHFLSHAAMVDKILTPPKGSDREKILSGHINLSGIDLKPFRKLRNHLEHFDERLDKWISELHGHAFFDMNLIAETKGFPKTAFLRALDTHHYKFQGEDYDLDCLHESLIAIRQRLSTN